MQITIDKTTGTLLGIVAALVLAIVILIAGRPARMAQHTQTRECSRGSAEKCVQRRQVGALQSVHLARLKQLQDLLLARGEFNLPGRSHHRPLWRHDPAIGFSRTKQGAGFFKGRIFDAITPLVGLSEHHDSASLLRAA